MAYARYATTINANAEAKQILENGRKAAAAGDTNVWNHCSDDCHLIFYRYCNNSRLTESTDRLRSGISIFSNQYSQETGIQSQIDDEHQTIFNAYQNGEIEKAVEMMKSHLNDSLAYALSFLPEEDV